MINYNLEQYRNWLEHNVTLTNAFSPASLRILTHHILMGRNYRLLTETNTKDKLLFTYLWLTDIVNNAKQEFGNNWQVELTNDLSNINRKSPEQKNLLFWLLGLTQKTSDNLGISKADIPSVMTELVSHVTTLFNVAGKSSEIDNAWLLMMAGSATLNIRGSEKSTIGKQVEKVLIRALFTILGLEQNINFWNNLDRDNEVDREADAEVETRRGRIRVEVGLIGSGNQEVTEDKIGRVGNNGIILFDKVGARTRIYQTAQRHGVKLVQIRNNQPLVEVHRHLSPLVRVQLNTPPLTEENVLAAVNALDDSIFTI